MIRRIWTLLCFLCWVGPLAAHEFGAVQVKASFDQGRYEVVAWVDPEHLPPGLKGQGFREAFAAQAQLSFDGQSMASPAEFLEEPGRLGFRWGGEIPAGAGAFAWGHPMPLGQYLIALKVGEGTEIRQWMEGGRLGRPFALGEASRVPGRLRILARYVALGFTHILPGGADHILFVLGLFFLCQGLRPMLWQVSAFTVAHSITLGLGMAGALSLPSRVVEPLIALSIVAVAVENMLVRELRLWRVGLVFAFGLLHGLGFAGALREQGLPPGELLPGLLAFNLGVEAGQLAVLGMAFLAVGLAFGSRSWFRGRVAVPASAAIGLVGLYWTFERVLGGF